MFGVTTSDDYRPVGWIGRFPVRVTSILCALFVLGMFATAICQSARWDLTPLVFQSSAFLHGRVWQPLTCTLIQSASFFFLFNIFFFYWAGNAVEQFLGIRRYLVLLGLLLLVPPIVLIACGPMGALWSYYGSYELSIGMFIAFATLYPGIELFGWVTMKWLAFAGLVLASMQTLPNHEWGNLFILWGMCLVAFLFIRWVQGRLEAIDSLGARLFQRRPKFKVVPKPAAARGTEMDEDVYESIDPLLEKISQQGLNSLTPSERRALDRARNRLLKKGS